jgi:hypothetical protein
MAGGSRLGGDMYVYAVLWAVGLSAHALAEQGMTKWTSGVRVAPGLMEPARHVHLPRTREYLTNTLVLLVK